MDVLYLYFPLKYFPHFPTYFLSDLAHASQDHSDSLIHSLITYYIRRDTYLSICYFCLLTDQTGWEIDELKPFSDCKGQAFLSSQLADETQNK